MAGNLPNAIGAVTSVSDRALRAAAWAVWWFLVAVAAAGLPLALADVSASPDTWGGMVGGAFAGDLAFLGVVLSFPLVGLVILLRQPRTTIGWVLMGIGLAWGLTGIADGYAVYWLVVDPGSLPRPDAAAAIGEGGWVPAVGLTGTFLILLFPDGHLPSRRWRPVAWLSAVTIALVTVAVCLSPGPLEESPVPILSNPLGLESAEKPLNILGTIFLPLLPVCMITAAVALVRRFRGSRGIERQQLKWLAAAGAVVVALYAVTLLASLPSMSSNSPPAWVGVLQVASLVSFLVLPVAIGVAVLKYRLFDLDIVIKRTIVYGAPTAALLATYLTMILLLQLALNPVTSDSDLAVAASTLTVAALFRPLRARIQRVVDRRFFRRRYDAARTLERFAVHLRDEIDLETLGVDLRRVVDDTVQPAHVSLWLRVAP